MAERKNEGTGGSPSEEERYRANPDFIFREIAGESILVPTGTMAHELNAAIVLSESGAVLWKHLEQAPCTVKELAGFLQEEYEVEEAVALQDAASFLEGAAGNQLVFRC